MRTTHYDDKRVFHKAARLALGKSQNWLANKLYVKPSVVSLYERGEDSELYSEDYQTRLSLALTDEIERQVKDHGGKWYNDIINLKIAINTIDICKNNPKEQKKAHEKLLMPLFSAKKITPWIYIVKDPAFGEMELFDKEEKRDDK